MSYRNLLERAKPEFKKAIATYKVDYPHQGEWIEKHLSENFGLTFLPYGVVLDLETVARRAKIEYRLVWDLFEEN